jgi:UPF0755 protein
LNKFFIQNKKIILITLAVFGAILLLFALVAGYYFYYLNTPLNKNSAEVAFVVKPGDGVRAVAGGLESSKIIRGDYTFMVYLKLSGLSSSIQAGEYKLSGAMSPLTVADILTKGKVNSRRITIPEGWTIREIGAYLEKEGVVKSADFVAATKKDYNYDFLVGKPAGVDLEGFLFPDTYQISATATADDIVKTMLDNFGRRVTPDMRAAANKSSLGLYGTITLASMVEKEANKPVDRKVVAGIFESRLNEGMRLQSDVTVAYALGEDRKELTAADLKLNSPYNTYVVEGLPLGPICNPGLDAINAVIYPEVTSYRYFIAANEQMYYAKTIDEHNTNVAKYLR